MESNDYGSTTMTPFDLAKSGSEFAEQQALIAWANMAANFGPRAANDLASYSIKGWAKNEYAGQGVPELARLFAIKNAGHGDVIRGHNAKREGVKSGVPDLMLPCPVIGEGSIVMINGCILVQYAGLFIEMKRKDSGRTSSEQNDWISFLQQQGYRAEVCHGWEAARDVLLEYLGLTS